MYTFIFYGIIIAIFISLFFNIDFQKLKTVNFSDKQEEQITQIKRVEKAETYSYTDRIKRWDFYLNEWFLKLASWEYSNAILEEENWEAYLKLAKTQITLWEFEKAESNLLTAIWLEQSEEMIETLIRLKIKQSNFKTAFDLIGKLEIWSENARYLKLILWLLNRDYETSLIELNEFLSESQDSNVKAKLMWIKDAFSEFESYKDWKNEHLELLIAKALSRAFEFEMSTKLTLQIVEAKWNYRDAWIILWYNYLRIWNIKKALANLQKAYELDSTKPETLFYLWLVYEDMWKKQFASDFYKKALAWSYEPRSHIIQKLAELSSENWDHQLAIQMYREMLSLNSSDIKNFYYPIEILINKIKDYGLALRFGQWAERRHPDNAFAYSLIWWTYIVNDDLKKAKESIQKSISMDSDIANNYLYAWIISERLWDIKTALRQYSIAYKKDLNWKIWREAVQRYNKILNN